MSLREPLRATAALLAFAMAVACTQSEGDIAQVDETHAPSDLTDFLGQVSFEAYESEHFSMRFPKGAKVDTDPEFRWPNQISAVTGSTLVYWPPDSTGMRESVLTYELAIHVLENPDRIRLESFVDSLWEDEASIFEDGTTSTDFMAISSWFRRPVAARIGVMRAIWYRGLCADCIMYKVHFGRDDLDLVVQIDYYLDGGDGQLGSGGVSRALCAFILSSFRWKERAT